MVVAYEKEVESFCESIGLKKKQVESVKSVVKTERDLQDFKNFIIENDGKFRTNLMLVHSYVMAVDFKVTYPVGEFVADYQNNKVEALKRISKGMYNNDVLHKVESLIENGLTLDSIYNKVVNENINILQVLNLLKKDVDIIA